MTYPEVNTFAKDITRFYGRFSHVCDTRCNVSLSNVVVKSEYYTKKQDLCRDLCVKITLEVFRAIADIPEKKLFNF